MDPCHRRTESREKWIGISARRVCACVCGWERESVRVCKCACVCARARTRGWDAETTRIRRKPEPRGAGLSCVGVSSPPDDACAAGGGGGGSLALQVHGWTAARGSSEHGRRCRARFDATIINRNNGVALGRRPAAGWRGGRRPNEASNARLYSRDILAVVSHSSDIELSSALIRCYLL